MIDAGNSDINEQTQVALPTDNKRHNRRPVEIPGYAVGVPGPDDTDDFWEVLMPDSDPVTITELTALGLHFTGRAYFDEDDQVWIAMRLGGEMRPVRGVVLNRTDFKDDSGGEYFGYGLQFLKTDFAPSAVAAILDYLQPPKVKSRAPAVGLAHPPSGAPARPRERKGLMSVFNRIINR